MDFLVRESSYLFQGKGLAFVRLGTCGIFNRGYSVGTLFISDRLYYCYRCAWKLWLQREHSSLQVGCIAIRPRLARFGFEACICIHANRHAGIMRTTMGPHS